VSFGNKSRYIGEAAKTQEISNLKNTVGSLPRLAGRSLKDPDVQIEQEYISAPLIDINGEVGAEVTYLGEKKQFTATQLMAMFFGKVKTTASAELKLPVSDIVLSCPHWFTDRQRRSILDAAEIAGLKVLRLINDMTAVALGYGITKLDLPSPEEKPKRVAFVDIGHSNYTCSIVEFHKGQLTVKSTASDRHFGGRNIDKALVDHFAREFKERYKIDINTNSKARFRVLQQCERLKKILSANAFTTMSIESLMNDMDVKGTMRREEMEALVRPLLDRATQPIEQALAEAKFKIEDIDAIEMVGGCTRVPGLKNAIQQFFGRPLSYTLNQDEAVARGCAFSCAILSPVFRVRDFQVHDVVNYPIEFTWEKSEDIPDEDTSLTVFNKGGVLPSTKILTFFRKQPFDLEARYAKPELLPGKMNPWIGRFSVKGVKADSKDDFMICKLKARLNLHGVLDLNQAYYVEDVEVEETAPDREDERKDPNVGVTRATLPTLTKASGCFEAHHDSDLSPPHHPAKRFKPAFVSEGSSLSELGVEMFKTGLTETQAMETDQPNGEATKPKIVKKRKQVRKGDLPLSTGTSSLDQANKDKATELENNMIMEDKLVADTEDKKNELESFIYELRGHIDDRYAEFANEEEKDRIRAKCTDTEVKLSTQPN
jgi:heat shock protein 4